ncbi:hypothetical protein JI723_06855 [Providencia manganoxydans]|uniref:Uncharacterized protein n=1 Tax=Providencia manganoxydans TaxID=2923283 RepID=A0ABX7AIA0_9GAMM|nr:hypothetical protein [Providencia sp. PROV035]MCL0019001.1 hypothetical protein [Providencia rettgeri]QQO63685.1 hypothetical protein JI723_06855 [Providencia manganoxydans]
MDEFTEKIKKQYSVPENHTLVSTGFRWEGSRKGQDTDAHTYQQIDENGNVCAEYLVKDSTSIYPPQKRTISISKR